MTDARREAAEPAREDLDDALASVMNVEADAASARADDPEPAPEAPGDPAARRSPAEVLRMDASIAEDEPGDGDGEGEQPRQPKDRI